MEKFIKSPNLPEGKVSYVIVSNRIHSVVQELKDNFHISVTVPEALPEISGEERFHADMGVCHLGEDSFIVESSNKSVINMLKEKNAKHELCECVTAKMPMLNVCITGDKIICNKNKADKRILSYAESKGLKILHTNQGYTKCSSAVVYENALITSDRGIYELCRKNNIDILLISEGNIGLSGYPYGFIGGCCGKLAPDVLAFSGRINNHPDHENIKAFAKNYGVDIISLGSENLYDIGGIIPVTEEMYNF